MSIVYITVSNVDDPTKVMSKYLQEYNVRPYIHLGMTEDDNQVWVVCNVPISQYEYLGDFIEDTELVELSYDGIPEDMDCSHIVLS